MSESSREQDAGAEQVGAADESSHDADMDAAMAPADESDATTGSNEYADENVTDSHAADVNAGFDDPTDSPADQNTITGRTGDV